MGANERDACAHKKEMPPQDRQKGGECMSKRNKREPETVRRMMDEQPSPTDPQGSWTGKPMEPDEMPVQDADDL